ncbi:MAG: ABC transporter permease [Odoribacteraceae bacterium]|jgi:ABC-type antimicrobial peptide transport system permease subunit|nr:ABC transporter permease [Odoribacteraceae bacterium]
MNYLALTRHYLAITARDSWKHRGNNLINLIGLSVALACFTLCMYVARSLTVTDKEFENSSRAYTIIDSTSRYHASMPTLGEMLARDFPDVEQYATVEFHNEILFETGERNELKFMLRAMEVTPSFLDFFSVDLAGVEPNAGRQHNTILLTTSTAKKIFGSNEEATGKIIHAKRESSELKNGRFVEKEYAYTVRGVIPDFKHNSQFNLHGGTIHVLFLNDEAGHFAPGAQYGWSAVRNFVKLRPGADVNAINRALGEYSGKIKGIFHDNKNRYYLLPYGSLRNTTYSILYLLAGILGFVGLLVLLTSLFNHAAGAVASFLDKRRECAIRESAGAGRWARFFFFYTGTAVTVIIAGALAACWLHALSPYLEQLTRMLRVEIDIRVLDLQLLQYVVAGLLVVFLLLLLPTRSSARGNIHEASRKRRGRRPRQRARVMLLGLQLFISILLASAAFVMHLQLRHFSSVVLHALSPAERARIIEIDTEHSLLAPRVEEIARALRAIPAVEEVIATGTRVTSAWRTRFKHEGEWIQDNVGVMDVDPDYFAFINEQLVEGRLPRDASEIVVNERARKILGKENVIGEVVETYNNNRFTIVGVAENMLHANVQEEIPAIFFRPREDTRVLYAKVLPGRTRETREKIRGIIREYLPETIDYSLPTLEESIEKVAQVEGMLFRLISIFSIISVVISLMGVYSSVLLATERRRKEVAIRKINGATLAGVIALFLRSYLLALLVAAIPACALVYALTMRWIETYAHRVTLHWWIYLVIPVAFAVLLTLTVIRRLVATARMHPADIIKTE